jgi:phosphatidylinositol alpha-1,6-mannosyltransferase
MYLIVTRSFPPELGGMQSLMWGLARELSKNFMIKVFADYIENHKNLMNKQHFLLKELVDLNYLENIEKPI